MMRRNQGWCLAPVALLCASLLYLVPAGWAQTVELQINNPPSNNVLDGIYVGSYSANNLTSGGSVQITCDDFRDESDYNSWTYSVNTLTLSSLGNTLWGQQLGATTATLQLYEEAAWLTMDMLGQTGKEQGYYSYAIWAIFQPSQVAAWLTSADDITACNTVFGNGAWTAGSCTPSKGSPGTGLLAMAANAEKSFYAGEFANVLILTPQNCGTTSCPEQEFIEIVAEGGSTAVYLLLAGFACFGAMFFRSRLQVSEGTVA